jgi:hypothetical protein
MGSRKRGIVVVFLVLAASIGINGLFSTASALTINVSIVNQPADARKGELITHATFDPTGGDGPGFVQVQVTDAECIEGTCPIEGAEVSFELATGDGLASGTLNVDSRFTDENGIATFDPQEGSGNPLNIEDANNPFTTHYELVPVAVPPPPPPTSSEPPIGAAFALDGTTGGPSDPFDVWGDGCKGNGCTVNLTPGTSSDEYTLHDEDADVALGASQLLNAGNGTNISCPTQQLVFASAVFFHQTTGNGPVFLVTHISAADRKRVPNNGNKVMGWCVGLEEPGPWNFKQQDTNNSGGIDSGDLYVGMAPKCPKRNAMNFDPCIVSQGGDGVGGTFIRGWLPGGDPPRRT